MIILFASNAILVAGGVFSAILATLRPSALVREGAEGVGVRFYAQMYAAKAVPLCLLAADIPFLSTGVLRVTQVLCGLWTRTFPAPWPGTSDGRLRAGR